MKADVKVLGIKIRQIELEHIVAEESSPSPNKYRRDLYFINRKKVTQDEYEQTKTELEQAHLSIHLPKYNTPEWIQRVANWFSPSNPHIEYGKVNENKERIYLSINGKVDNYITFEPKVISSSRARYKWNNVILPHLRFAIRRIPAKYKQRQNPLYQA